ncbi:MAG: AgmX/PglI C-terminal domain-containing protein [Deltaproteobacteria bacterium]|nr:AgmX/PglI C-terminal domain-containing protein [Deltaproteobacteria bacterium]
MRRWVLVLLAGPAGLLGAGELAACGSGSTQRPHEERLVGRPAGRPARAGPGHDTADAPVLATMSPGSRPDGAAIESATGPASATPLAGCEHPLSVILNHPDGGVVFNNAMTSADAGFIDRTQGVLDAIGGAAQQFRCCLDGWAGRQRGVEATAMLVLLLGPDGTVAKASVDPERSTLKNPTTEACLLAVARRVTYPASPTGKETTVEYPFRFLAARAP